MATNSTQSVHEPTSDLGVLSERGWLAEQTVEFQSWAARNGRWRTYESRQIIYDAGEPADALYGLGEGAIEVTFPLVGDEPVVLYRAEIGFWIGDSAIFADTGRMLSICAATRCRVLRIPATAMRDLVSRSSQHWRAFYSLSHINSLTAVTLLAEALALTPKARLARTLQRLAGPDGRTEVTQLELARLIGMTRSTMQRSISELTESGAIETGYRSFVVRDVAALERAARDR